MKRFLLITMVFVLAACATSTGDGTEYQAYEFGIDGPTTLSAGVNTFSVSNVGDFSHTFVVTDAAGDVVFAPGVLPSGEVAEVELDFEEGTYLFTCRLVVKTETGKLIDHFENGMNLTVEVSG